MGVLLKDRNTELRSRRGHQCRIRVEITHATQTLEKTPLAIII